MKRTRLKRKSKTEKAKLKDKLWLICKEIVRKRDGNVCVSCGQAGLEGKNWHTGHLIPKSTCGALLKYDLRNIHSQCYNCNINLGGNGANYHRALEEKYGREWLDGFIPKQHQITKEDEIFLQNLINEYTPLLELSQEELQQFTHDKNE